MEARIARLEVLIDSIKVDTNSIKQILEGDVHPGMKIRLDRLEQNDARRKWQVRALAGSTLTVIGYYIRSIIG